MHALHVPRVDVRRDLSVEPLDDFVYAGASVRLPLPAVVDEVFQALGEVVAEFWPQVLADDCVGDGVLGGEAALVQIALLPGCAEQIQELVALGLDVGHGGDGDGVGEDVGAGAILLSEHDLGRDVEGGTDGGHGLLGVVHDGPALSEVAELGGHVVGDEDVVGLQVPVDDALLHHFLALVVELAVVQVLEPGDDVLRRA